jgi:hypothetical protein
MLYPTAMLSVSLAAPVVARGISSAKQTRLQMHVPTRWNRCSIKLAVFPYPQVSETDGAFQGGNELNELFLRGRGTQLDQASDDEKKWHVQLQSVSSGL